MSTGGSATGQMVTAVRRGDRQRRDFNLSGARRRLHDGGEKRAKKYR
jgi:hypothetical protein